MDKKDEQGFLMKQLYEETFKTDVDIFSADRVELLVKLMELNDPIDEGEVEASKKKIRSKIKKKIKKTQILILGDSGSKLLFY